MTTPDATILLVEDEDSFVEALTVGLRREGIPGTNLATERRRSRCSTPSSPTSCCST